jgi:hypothetical protein
MEFAIAIRILRVRIVHILLALILVVDKENAFQANASATIISKEKIAANLFATVTIEENAYSIKSVFAIMAFMENIAKKAFVKIIAIRMELAIKENVFVKADGEEKLVTFVYVLMTVMEMENV